MEHEHTTGMLKTGFVDFEPRFFGGKACLEIMDLHTRFAYAYPVKNKEAGTTAICIRDFIGSDAVDLIYSDGHESIISAAEQLGILIEVS